MNIFKNALLSLGFIAVLLLAIPSVSAQGLLQGDTLNSFEATRNEINERVLESRDDVDASTRSRDRLSDVSKPAFGNSVTSLDGETGLKTLVAQIIRIALGFLGIIFLGLVIYSGFLYMTAGGNDDQVGKARKIFVTSLIGLIIVVSAFTISTFVLQSIQKVITN